MTASNDSDPHRKNGAKNLKLLFSGITCVLLRAAGYAFFSAKRAYSAQNKIKFMKGVMNPLWIITVKTPTHKI